MKLLVVAITFAVTIGALFLFDTRKTADTTEKNYAQILEGLETANNSGVASPTPVKKTVPQKTQTVVPVVIPTQILTSAPSQTLIPSSQPIAYQIEVTSITSPVKQNSIAEVKIKTAPEAQCAIKVTLPSGGQSAAKGLEPKTADSSGVITWSWRINWNTKPGTAITAVNCTKDDQNFSKILQMEITE